MGIQTSILIASCLLAGDAKEGKPAKKPRFTIGKETTYVLGPKDEAGYIDYFAALNERLSKGVTPENNAAVLLIQAFGPSREKYAPPPEFFKMLGMKPPPNKGDYFINANDFLKDRLQNDEDRERLYEEMDRTIERPWKAKDFPHIAAWLGANEKPLAVALEATRRRRYYMPAVARNPRQSVLIISTHLYYIQEIRELGVALATRAMLHVGEGRNKDAWRDLLACHRLARLVACNASSNEALIGAALNSIAAQADLAFLEHSKLDSKSLQQCLRDLQGLPPMPSFAERIEFNERLGFLDVVQTIERDGPDLLEEGVALQWDKKFPKFFWNVALADLDFDHAFRTVNRIYDDAAAILRDKEDRKRTKRDEFERDIPWFWTLPEEQRRGPVLRFLFGGKSGKERAEMMVGLLRSFLGPSIRKFDEVEDRTEQVHRNLQIAFALEMYRREHGRYPMRLDDIAPRYLKSVPRDVFTGKALVYRPRKDGYLLYSLGPNRIDESGRQDDELLGDDPAVRMPLPRWEERFSP